MKIEAAAKAISNDAVNDVQAQASALIASCREERIKRLVPDIEAHAAAVVEKENFEVVAPGRPNLDVNCAFRAVGKSVPNRVEEEIGQHLAIWPGIAIHRQVRFTLDI